VKAKIINCSYDKGQLKWWLVSNVKGKVRAFSYMTPLPFKDYFFCNRTQKNLIENLYPTLDIMRTDFVFADHFRRGQDVYQVNLSPYRKSKIRVELETEFGELISEADVGYIDLVFKDLGIYSAVEISNGQIQACEDFDIDIPHCFFDIETEDRPKILNKSEYKTFAKPDVARLLSFSIWDTQEDKVKFFTDKNEERLLNTFKTEIEKYIRVEAWNGEEFDYTMIKGRMKEHRIKFDWKRFYTLDSMKIHEMLNPKERKFLAIDSIAKKYLDMRKIKHTQGFYEMYEDYHSGKSTLLEEYNNRDVEIMAKLEDKFGFGGVVMETAFSVGMLPHRYTYARKPSQVLIRRNSLDHYGERFVWKSKSEVPEKIKFTGATVQDPIHGRWKNVVGIDLASLYNLIIQTFNISPEQLQVYEDHEPLFYIEVDDEGNKLLNPVPIFPHDYKRYDRDGIMRKTLQQVEVRRNHFKDIRNDSEGEKYKLYDMKQQGEKAVLLSLYGGLGARGSTRQKEGSGTVSGRKEFYDWYCADDVTRYAREIIQIAVEVVEAMGYKVVYGDTDSIYIWLGNEDFTTEQVKTIVRNMLNKINDKYGEWMTDLGVPKEWQKIKMEAQGYYSPFIVFDKKKNYVARELWNGENNKTHAEDHIEIYGKGLKPFKPTATDFHKYFLKTLYEKILTYTDPKELDIWIKKHQKDLMEGKYEDQMVFEKKLTKYVYHDNESETYANLTADVEYAKRMIDAGKLQEKGAIYFKYGYYGDRESKDGSLKRGIVCIGEFQNSKRDGREYFWKNHVLNDVNEVMNVCFAEWDEEDNIVRDWKAVLYQTTLDEWF